MSLTDPGRALSRHSDLADALRRLRAALPGDTWVVGGFLRDLLRGARPYDLDLAVDGEAGEAARAAAAELGGAAFPLDEQRDTWRVTPPEGAALRTIDFARLRGPGIETDLRARDFTVNAMAALLTPEGLGPLLDPAKGARDLDRHLVRAVSEEALREDPLRLLRAVRLAVELRFNIERSTRQAMRRLAPLVVEPAAERVRDELMRILASGHAAVGVRMLDEMGLLAPLLPELTSGRGVSQPGRFHHYDVFDHGVEALAVTDWLLSEAPPDGDMQRAMRAAYERVLGRFALRDYFGERQGGASRLVLTKLATLLHDIAKPQTKSTDDQGRVRFLGHSEAGARLAGEICRRLRMGNRETDFVQMLVEEHLRPAQLSSGGLPSDRAIFRFFRRLGDAAKACLVLSLADAAAARGPRLDLSRWTAHLAYIEYVLERGTAQREVLGGRHFVSGDTLIRALNIRPGPEVGRLLAQIDEAAGTGAVATEEQAIRYAKRLRQRWKAREAGVG